MKQARVMLVEDERIVALNLKRKLMAMGYEISASAVSGEQALALVRQNIPDIILMDINIEGEMDGIDTAASILSEFNIPVIYLTAYSGEETLDRARTTRPFGYVLKPFSDRELHATIQMALERHRLECTVEKGEQRLKLALDAARMGVLELDPESHSIHYQGHSQDNPIVSGGVFFGDWEKFISTVHVDDRELLNKVLNWTVEEGRLCQVEYRLLQDESQEIIWLRLIGKAISQRDSSVQIVGVIQDVTHYKAIDILRREKEIAETTSRFKSEFLASMSHEIRTPLNGVIGMVDLLQRTELDEVQKSYTKIIQSSGKTLLAVINDILDFSKVEAGKIQLVNQCFDLGNLIEECVAAFRASSKQAVEFIVSIAPGTPMALSGDTVRLKQVISNLLSNAFKFTEQGQVVLRVESTLLELDLVRLNVAISDSGIGIPDDRLEQLFKPFSQVNDSRRQQGTGLGLLICKKLVELMDGNIQVESRPGVGSTFSFTALLKRKPVSLAVANSLSLENLKLLSVDNSREYLQIISEQAKYLGIKVITIMDPELATGLALREKPDLITIDLDMPKLNGFELEQRLASNPDLKDVPRILLTASSILPGAKQLAETGFIAAHVKPTSVEQLKSILSDSLSGEVKKSDVKPLPDTPVYPGKTILVAEDNTVNRKVIIAMLHKFEPDIVVVNDGQQALERATAPDANFDLIFMDCDMPVMDGYEATRKIRAHERQHGRGEIPIVALTAHALNEHREFAREAGMNQQLHKPVSLNELGKVLDDYLADSQRT